MTWTAGCGDDTINLGFTLRGKVTEVQVLSLLCLSCLSACVLVTPQELKDFWPDFDKMLC
jgi:hypothetical protein